MLETKKVKIGIYQLYITLGIIKITFKIIHLVT